MHRNFDSEVVVFDKNSFNLDDLLQWANEHAHPYVGEVSQQFERIAKRGLPMGLIFVDDEDEEDLASLLSWASPLAKELYSKISFAYVGKKKISSSSFTTWCFW